MPSFPLRVSATNGGENISLLNLCHYLNTVLKYLHAADLKFVELNCDNGYCLISNRNITILKLNNSTVTEAEGIFSSQ